MARLELKIEIDLDELDVEEQSNSEIAKEVREYFKDSQLQECWEAKITELIIYDRD